MLTKVFSSCFDGHLVGFIEANQAASTPLKGKYFLHLDTT